jgi:hypothetical protein
MAEFTDEEVAIIIAVTVVSTAMVVFAVMHFWYKDLCLKEKLRQVKDSDFIYKKKR